MSHSVSVLRREVRVDGVPLDLPRRELLVLEALLRGAGRAATRGASQEAVYGLDGKVRPGCSVQGRLSAAAILLPIFGIGPVGFRFAAGPVIADALVAKAPAPSRSRVVELLRRAGREPQGKDQRGQWMHTHFRYPHAVTPQSDHRRRP